MLPELEHGYNLPPPSNHVKNANFESIDVEWGLRSAFLLSSLAVSSGHGRAGPRLRHTLKVYSYSMGPPQQGLPFPKRGPPANGMLTRRDQ